MRYLIFSFFLLLKLNASSQGINIVPLPNSIKTFAGSFSITKSTKILVEGTDLINSADFLNDYLHRFYGFRLQVITKGDYSGNIVLGKERMDYPIVGAYRLIIKKEGVLISGDNETGSFYGIQSLIQLLPLERSESLTVPFLTIEDAPRFAYRGMLLDVGRHFFPVSFIKKFIDFLAMHKMNTFHWHLTEDQGWRIEIKKYPKLTEIGSSRNGTIIGRFPGTGNDKIKHSGFYSQEEIKEVVAYAAKRYVDIIPEIELPGHASAAIAAYPELSCFPKENTMHSTAVSWYGDSTGKQVQQAWGVYPDVFCPSEYTFKFLQDVFDEITTLFPGKYIHIGGDECPKEFWKRSDFCQKLIKEKGLKDENGLQSYFIKEIEKYLNKKGKQMIGWDEIIDGGLAPNATVMSWRGEEGGLIAVKQKHKVVMTPNSYVYLDYAQFKKEDSLVIGGYLPIEKVYGYDPVSKEMTGEDSKYVMGAQANVWTEYMNNESKVEYMIFPRMSALSEVLWTRKENKNWNTFKNKMPSLMKRYDWLGIQYGKEFETH